MNVSKPAIGYEQARAALSGWTIGVPAPATRLLRSVGAAAVSAAAAAAATAVAPSTASVTVGAALVLLAWLAGVSTLWSP